MLFLAFLALSAPLVACLDAPTQVPIAVYYEALCPDSIKFITSQLYPVYTSGLKQRINITLVPFGKAVKNSGANGPTFECRHGAVECYGDKVQACAIKIITDEGKRLSLINCLMGTASQNATYPVDSCGATTGVLNLEEIVTCANGTQGDTLLTNYADQTTPLQIKNVPTIIVNETFSEENQNLAVSNLRQLICGHLEGDKPGDCKNTASGSAVASISAILFFVVSRMF